MAEALCLRSIPAPTTSFSYARYYCHYYCSTSYSSSTVLLLKMKNRGGSHGLPIRSQDIKHKPRHHQSHGLSPHLLLLASMTSFTGLLPHHNQHPHHAVCSKKKAYHGKESLHTRVLPSHRPWMRRYKFCDGVRDVMFGGYFFSSSSSSSFLHSPISSSSFRISMDTECGAASTIPSHNEEDVLDKITTSIPEPPILKRGLEIPQKWNIPGGTVVLMDKPKGWTSFTVCAKIRKLVQVKKVGHAGTLDPMATGLLVVCVGPATKLADSFQALDKVYTGTFRLGEATSSCDADSPVIESKSWEHISDTNIQIVKEKFVGEIMQIPPMFSAIKVDGERLYEKARRGEQIDVPARKITIYDFQIERNEEDRQLLDFYVRCSKGTYIRSLCADMGRALDSCAHLTKLRREKIGDLCVDDAWQFQDLAEIYSTLYGAR